MIGFREIKIKGGRREKEGGRRKRKKEVSEIVRTSKESREAERRK